MKLIHTSGGWMKLTITPGGCMKLINILGGWAPARPAAGTPALTRLWGRNQAKDTQGLEVGVSPAMRKTLHPRVSVSVCLAVPVPWQEMAFQQLWPAGGFISFL